MSGKRKGILGGTFDPIHQVHLLLGLRAREEFSLDEVIFMPAGTPYLKTRAGRQVTAAEDRAAMVRLAIAPYPYFTFSDREIRRKKYTYTAETLQEICREDPSSEYFFIVGADSLAGMDTWKDPQVIFSLAAVIVANRNAQVPEQELDETIRYLTEKYGARIYLMDFESVDLSSSDIRRALEEDILDRKGLPAAVYEYIREHNLYPEEDVDAGE